MTIKEVRSAVFDLIMALLISIFFIVTLTYNAKARFVPLIISTPVLAIAWARVLGTVINLWRQAKRKEQAIMPESTTPEEKAAVPEKQPWRKEMVAVGWIILLLAMVYLIGFIWTIPLFIFVSLRFRSHEPLKLSILISLGAWIFMYTLFGFLLKIEFANGYLIDLFLG